MAAFYRVTLTTSNNEDLRQAFALTDTAGAALDLTGADLHLAILAVPGASTPALALDATLANGRIQLPNPAAGQFEIAIPAAVMRTLTPGSYRHDLVVTMAAGDVQRVWSGALTVEPGVSA